MAKIYMIVQETIDLAYDYVFETCVLGYVFQEDVSKFLDKEMKVLEGQCSKEEALNHLRFEEDAHYGRHIWYQVEPTGYRVYAEELKKLI